MAFESPREQTVETPLSGDDVHLIPGATIAAGRYRLLVSHGGPAHLQFWQALDTALDRQVALTFVDPPGSPAQHNHEDIAGCDRDAIWNVIFPLKLDHPAQMAAQGTVYDLQ